MAKMSFKKFEEKIYTDITEIVIHDLKYEHRSSYGDLRFMKMLPNRNIDMISISVGKAQYSKQAIHFNIYFSRKLEQIEKYIDPYIDFLLPFSAFKNMDYCNTFTTDEELRKKTDTYFYPNGYDYQQDLNYINLFKKPEDKIQFAENYDYQLLKERLIYLDELGQNDLQSKSDIRVLDQMANQNVSDTLVLPSNRGATSAQYHKMIIAKLSGNPLYEDIYKHFVNLMEEGSKKKPEYEEFAKTHIEIANKLYDDLKGVKKLENPILI
jgi:hypothetical protein